VRPYRIRYTLHLLIYLFLWWQLQAVVPRRINAAKPAVDQSVPASYKGAGGFGSGGRKMTVLGNGIGNNRQKEVRVI
jgi:hypothetical protein